VGEARNETAIPQMIAFAPSVELMFSTRERVHDVLLHSLIIAAIASKRTPALPLVPCDSPWINHISAGEHARQERDMDSSCVADRFVVQFGPKSDLQCFWKAWSCRACDRITIPWYDFRKLVEQLSVQERSAHEGGPLPTCYNWHSNALLSHVHSQGPQCSDRIATPLVLESGWSCREHGALPQDEASPQTG
jgi:hypothetical protein